jgi:hypothetical protein
VNLLNNIIDWLNNNEGFVFAILTLAYVSATIIIAIIMLKSNRLSRKSLELTAELDKRRLRPFLIFDIVIENHRVHVILKNIGLTAALNVKVDVEPKIMLEAGSLKKESSIVRDVIQFIAPQRHFSEFIDTSPNFFKRYPDTQFDVKINYRDADGTEYHETSHFDLNFQRDW